MQNFEYCGVYSVIKLINGKWKPFILYLLSTEDHAFNDIWRRIPKVSKKVLSEHLKGLVEDELIESNSTKYRLTDKGRKLLPLLATMQNWSEHNLENIVETDNVLLPKT